MPQTSVNSFALTEVAGDGQITGLNQAFPHPFVVRLTDSNGNPLAGAHIYFETEPCLSILGSLCEFPGGPGHFVSGADHATVATNAAGFAISPVYYAGSSLGIPGTGINLGAIGVTAFAVPNEAPYFFSIPAALTNYVPFFLTEVPPLASASASVPFVSGPALGILCLLLVIVAILRLPTSSKR